MGGHGRRHPRSAPCIHSASCAASIGRRIHAPAPAAPAERGAFQRFQGRTCSAGLTRVDRSGSPSPW
ncbi:Hypothetical protein CAP_2784 [Chondromyces apiculatus DSM 436]|uniref:Uncharacterized protein n=1 Tax=Chondromyces apiculatus DSM 436 TaxID=1192034 RepID=A0A017T933_9BACT|nr:Hypothetical protein CAP_2784 [Chondromyces apiculatus DSM 436]